MTRSAEIRAVLREGKRIRLDSMEIRVMPSAADRPRVAVLVPRFRHTIVDRNRLKRRLRELVRLVLLPSLGDGAIDVVVRASPKAYTRTFDQLRQDVGQSLARLAS